ncbi:flagellar protein FlaG [Dissulfurirhabdus thermomarina]|uniref:Flagellar protein FlaG n=1 Tax=Dissulfurirhabdus thermomarina TaxID=1765737 RepID=A0A6N9TVQ5_DISTH|nr:flagellar protein FlaG [Dissulfurirhabdus thermomarina]NDY42566.1 flagellar protein FlaG [Dissulfurirhabdus thermomarina]NMX23175.1 flagellar protein FlaG [Dissulfurirhabdus thermomarina]
MEVFMNAVTTSQVLNLPRPDPAGGEIQRPPARQVAPAPEETGAAAPPRGDEVRQVVDQIRQDLRVLDTRIAFDIDEASGEPVVRVLDRETNEVLRQIPPEELLKLRTTFEEIVKGLLLDRHA